MWFLALMIPPLTLAGAVVVAGVHLDARRAGRKRAP